MIVRLDKYLSMLGLVPRRQVGKYISAGCILVNGTVATKSDQKLCYGQWISFGGHDIEVKEFVYVVLHKKAGFVCSELDEGGHFSYKTLMQDCPYAAMLHVAGRLDQDTEGLVVCSNDGQFTHSIISPKKHLEKEYFLRVRGPLTQEVLDTLERGVVLDDGYQTMPAKAYWVDEQQQKINNVSEGSQGEKAAKNIAAIKDVYAMRLVIVEGKFHQVKRMLEAVGNEVTYLRRDRIGGWTIEGLELGEWRYIEVKNK